VPADLVTTIEKRSLIRGQNDTQDKDALCLYTREDLSSQQQHDLLGLALQTSAGRVPDDEVETSYEGPRAIDEDHIPTCPIHRSILSNTSIPIVPGGEQMVTPMDRYLAEGIQERYALVHVGISDSEEPWARYKDCLCMKT
jgi:hypothetical protein